MPVPPVQESSSEELLDIALAAYDWCHGREIPAADRTLARRLFRLASDLASAPAVTPDEMAMLNAMLCHLCASLAPVPGGQGCPFAGGSCRSPVAR